MRSEHGTIESERIRPGDVVRFHPEYEWRGAVIWLVICDTDRYIRPGCTLLGFGSTCIVNALTEQLYRVYL